MTTVRDIQERLWVMQLAKEFQDICWYYRLSLPVPHFFISDTDRRFGCWDEATRTLQISRQLIEEHSWDVVLEILKHEIAHVFVSEFQTGATEDPHGAFFQEACKRLGVAPWARRASVETDPATARTEHRRLSGEQERQLRRVEKLLSLSQSSNAHEAELAMATARRLAEEYQIETWKAEREQTFTYTLIEHGKKTLPSHQSAIASLLCSHFYVDCVTRSQFDARTGENHKVLEILGSLENVTMAEYIYWFIWNQLPHLWLVFKKSLTAHSRTSQRSFYLGVIAGLHQKLTAERQLKVDSSLSSSAQRSLVSPGDKTDQLRLAAERRLHGFIKERYPRLQRRSQRPAGLEYEAYASGQQTGRSLDIRPGLTQESHLRALASGRT